MNRRDFVTLLGGAALAWPLAARAQQQAMKVIGYLSPAWPRLAAAAPYWAAFRQGLGETGYVEGRNLAIEYRYAEGDRDRLPALAADLVGRKVDVIVAAVSARTAKEATSTIPIVFQEARDPVEAGLVASLARPGGNLTGFAGFNLELTPKRLELLTELVPQARVIALLADPTTPFSEPMISDVQEAARMKGVQLAVLKAGTESEIDAAFASLGQLRAGGLLVGGSVFFAIRREQIFALASHHAVPAMYDARGYVA
ncbi:MAG TPA: ABC transporter substrate-binding protein, partial [Stellaceae bacterium]|nr:ABC transporter substrate-binding protein [Stellaceae bacterium]